MVTGEILGKGVLIEISNSMENMRLIKFYCLTSSTILQSVIVDPYLYFNLYMIDPSLQ